MNLRPLVAGKTGASLAKEVSDVDAAVVGEPWNGHKPHISKGALIQAGQPASSSVPGALLDLSFRPCTRHLTKTVRITGAK